MTANEAVEKAIIEADNAKKYLGRIKSPQIKNKSDKDYLKTIVNSWFNSHRSAIASHITDQEALNKMDSKYKEILECTSRDSACATYKSKMKFIYSALVSIRGLTLTASPAVRSDDSPPDFTPIANPDTKLILVYRWEECARCLAGKANLASIVMIGGLLEALLLVKTSAYALDPTQAKKLYTAQCIPIDSNTGQKKKQSEWTLEIYISIAHELGWITHSVRSVAKLLQEYRNYVHVGKQISKPINLTNADSEICWGLVKAIARQLVV